MNSMAEDYDTCEGDRFFLKAFHACSAKRTHEVPSQPSRLWAQSVERLVFEMEVDQNDRTSPNNLASVDELVRLQQENKRLQDQVLAEAEETARLGAIVRRLRRSIRACRTTVQITSSHLKAVRARYCAALKRLSESRQPSGSIVAAPADKPSESIAQLSKSGKRGGVGLQTQQLVHTPVGSTKTTTANDASKSPVAGSKRRSNGRRAIDGGGNANNSTPTQGGHPTALFYGTCSDSRKAVPAKRRRSGSVKSVTGQPEVAAVTEKTPAKTGNSVGEEKQSKSVVVADVAPRRRGRRPLVGPECREALLSQLAKNEKLGWTQLCKLTAKQHPQLSADLAAVRHDCAARYLRSLRKTASSSQHSAANETKENSDDKSQSKRTHVASTQVVKGRARTMAKDKTGVAENEDDSEAQSNTQAVSTQLLTQKPTVTPARASANGNSQSRKSLSSVAKKTRTSTSSSKIESRVTRSRSTSGMRTAASSTQK